ncbi:MAG: hypothetical protein QOH42_785, partial [Blastocatellia bacterium]|nr:hypothetical protein [Blastocatellia bacterium]
QFCQMKVVLDCFGKGFSGFYAEGVH